MKKLIFKQNPNRKLNNLAFSHITAHMGLYREGDTVTVQMDLSTSQDSIIYNFGQCVVTSVRTFALYELTEEMARLESANSREQTMDELREAHPNVVMYDYVILVKLKNGKERKSKPLSASASRNPDGTVQLPRAKGSGNS